MATKAQRRELASFADLGFTLNHDGAIALALFHEGEFVARFSQTGATKETLQAECAKHLVTKHCWEGCLWKP